VTSGKKMPVYVQGEGKNSVLRKISPEMPFYCADFPSSGFRLGKTPKNPGFYPWFIIARGSIFMLHPFQHHSPKNGFTQQIGARLIGCSSINTDHLCKV
jgi:hypothetical protein